MAIGGGSSIDAHFTVLLIASIVVTLLFVSLSRKARKKLNALLIVFFIGFLVIMVWKARDVIIGT